MDDTSVMIIQSERSEIAAIGNIDREHCINAQTIHYGGTRDAHSRLVDWRNGIVEERIVIDSSHIIFLDSICIMPVEGML
jgi:hypothetical protein